MKAQIIRWKMISSLLLCFILTFLLKGLVFMNEMAKYLVQVLENTVLKLMPLWSQKKNMHTELLGGGRSCEHKCCGRVFQKHLQLLPKNLLALSCQWSCFALQQLLAVFMCDLGQITSWVSFCLFERYLYLIQLDEGS